jgi:hypothetical protein
MKSEIGAMPNLGMLKIESQQKLFNNANQTVRGRDERTGNISTLNINKQDSSDNSQKQE